MKTMTLQLAAIAVGATLGAWLRWGLSLGLPAWHGIPLGTLVANLAGGYAVGLAVAAFASHPGLSPEWRLFAITGLLGGLTTFSGFSIEAVSLLERQHYGSALGMIVLHTGGSLAMTALGIATVRLARAVLVGAQ